MNILSVDKQIATVAALTEGVSVLCRVHETLRVTPAMQLGITDHVWSIGELVDAALNGELPKPVGRKVGPFHVIDGGC